MQLVSTWQRRDGAREALNGLRYFEMTRGTTMENNFDNFSRVASLFLAIPVSKEGDGDVTPCFGKGCDIIIS